MQRDLFLQGASGAPSCKIKGYKRVCVDILGVVVSSTGGGKIGPSPRFCGNRWLSPPEAFWPQAFSNQAQASGRPCVCVCVSVQLVLGIYRGTAGYLHEVDPNVAGEKEANMLKTTSRKPPYPFGVLDDLDLDYPMILWVYGCLFQLTPKMRKMDFGFPFDKRVRFKTT